MTDSFEATTCPKPRAAFRGTCGMPAEILLRYLRPSKSGGEHEETVVICVEGHVMEIPSLFLLPTDEGDRYEDLNDYRTPAA